MVIYTSVRASELERSEGARRVQSLRGYAADSAPEREGASFGPAYVRESGNSAEAAPETYGPDARMVDKPEQRDRQARRDEAAKGEAVGGGKRGVDGKPLSQGDEELLARLEARDAKVRAHEAAHVTAAGGQAGMPTYTYQQGPDGRRYAVGGSVDISMLHTGDEEANARRAHKAYRAAMATGEPSTRDMQTAMRALSRAAEARGGAFRQASGREEPVAAPA